MRAWLGSEAVILRVADITPMVPILATKRERRVYFKGFQRDFERVRGSLEA